jgi:hypothetical protein
MIEIQSKKYLPTLISIKIHNKIMTKVIITSGYKIKGRRPNNSISFKVTIVAIKLIIPVDKIPQ